MASILQHFRNYRKPVDQRLIVRIQLLLPLYALSSWLGLTSETGSAIVTPIQEIYEAVVIYTFFTLLTNLLGGERNAVMKAMGRAPKMHLFPFNYCFSKVDISDPYTFLAIKRGILQYVWLKPIMCVLIVIMKATGTYQQNYIGLSSGYMWLGIFYNISISVSLYCLALFWYCLLEDLRPFRPLPKFLCIKIIIFFSYWQGVMLAILVWVGLIPSVGYYTPDNIATAIQNTLMCIEMLGFAVGHWYAFTYKEFASPGLMGYARLKMPYAIRDAFGCVDLAMDFKATFYGDNYNYREFNSIETVLEHPESRSRQARLAQGLRYQAGGTSKYWLPSASNSKGLGYKPLVEGSSIINSRHGNETDSIRVVCDGVASYGALDRSSTPPLKDPFLEETTQENEICFDLTEEEMRVDNKLYDLARTFPYGDYNVSMVLASIDRIFSFLTIY